MKPKPFSSLNHLTVPVAMRAALRIACRLHEGPTNRPTSANTIATSRFDSSVSRSLAPKRRARYRAALAFTCALHDGTAAQRARARVPRAAVRAALLGRERARRHHERRSDLLAP